MSRWTKFALGLAIIAGPFGSAIAEEVGYRVTFDATWSDATHGPEAFVGSAHFSPLVGNTHNSSVTFWEVGSLASVGIEMMAELGASAPLNAETQTAINAGTAYSFIAGSGISSPDSVDTSFIISSTHPLVTLVTMVAPSPDWFLGVSELELYSANVWLDNVVVDLFVYDAGTDNGVDFESLDSDTNPADPISLLGAPFTEKPKLGTFTFLLLGHCEDGIDNDGDGTVDLSDPGCSSAGDDSELSTVACDDGLDNDGDTFSDSADPGCASPADTSEQSTAECDDGHDNDGDLLVDFPADTNCHGPAWPSESLDIAAVPALASGARVALGAGLAAVAVLLLRRETPWSIIIRSNRPRAR